MLAEMEELHLLEADLYRTHRRVVFDFALRRTGNVTDAENLVQEAFAKVLLAARTKEIRHPRAYLLRTTANLANDLDRRRARELPDAPTPEPPVDRTDHARVRDAVASLPEPLRRVVGLRYGDDLSYGAIAEELGMSKNAVHHRHGRAMDALRRLLGLEP